MNEYRGWLLDVYANPQGGLILWIAGEDDTRHCFYHPFTITFYASAPFPRLRALWSWLRTQPIPVQLTRTKQQDLFAGQIEVLAVQVDAAFQARLFRQVLNQFPDIEFYNADVPLSVYFAAVYDVYPLTRCVLMVDDAQVAQQIRPLDSRWDIDAPLPTLRILTITPEVDPNHATPKNLSIRFEKQSWLLPLEPPRALLLSLRAKLRRFDPDIILTAWGDTWLFPYLLEQAQEVNLTFNPSRDMQLTVLHKQERNYFTYGQVVHRGHQVHLFGRWHIDQRNAMMFNQYQLPGVLEQARVTAMPVQEMARRSPGSGITAMQMITALKRGVLVPYKKQQAEFFKSARTLLKADRGGLVYQPLVGLHTDVAELDFVSMYPSIIAAFNISPETVAVTSNNMAIVPELGMPIDQEKLGLLPETLRPLLNKRIALKTQMASLNKRDCRYTTLKAKSTALKWLLVVAFGYAGYKSARFGRIEAHEAITAYSREAMLRAKETAEAMGYTVVHMYVDGLWVKRVGERQPADFQPLIAAITQQTGLPIAFEGVYKWIAFLPSKLDNRIPVPNRYFGAFQDGSLKLRGVEARRRDTPLYIMQTQKYILQRLVRIPDGQPLAICVPEIILMLQQCLAALRSGHIPLEQLLVAQTVSRNLDEYHTPSPAAKAARQLVKAGKQVKLGQSIRFLYTQGTHGVHAWDLPTAVNASSIDVAYYSELLLRAAFTVLEPIGVKKSELYDWAMNGAFQPRLPLLDK
jgi:DNA polymerase-2